MLVEFGSNVFVVVVPAKVNKRIQATPTTSTTATTTANPTINSKSSTKPTTKTAATATKVATTAATAKLATTNAKVPRGVVVQGFQYNYDG